MTGDLVAVHPEPVGEWRDVTAQALAAIADGEAALERAVEIAEIVELRDKAAAVGIFMVAQHMTEAAQRAKVLQLKAERKAGKWLTENVADGEDVRWHDGTALPDGITKSQSARWQLEAAVPQADFEAWIDARLSTGWELTAAGLRRLASGKDGGLTDAQRWEYHFKALMRIDLTNVLGPKLLPEIRYHLDIIARTLGLE